MRQKTATERSIQLVPLCEEGRTRVSGTIRWNSDRPFPPLLDIESRSLTAATRPAERNHVVEKSTSEKRTTPILIAASDSLCTSVALTCFYWRPTELCIFLFFVDLLQAGQQNGHLGTTLPNSPQRTNSLCSNRHCMSYNDARGVIP